jgi:hypothetical protein
MRPFAIAEPLRTVPYPNQQRFQNVKAEKLGKITASRRTARRQCFRQKVSTQPRPISDIGKQRAFFLT